MANLDLIENEGLVGAAAVRGAQLQALLHEAFDEHPLVGEVRGTALIAALEFVAEKDPPVPFDPARKVSARVTRRCLELVRIVRQAVDEVAAELRSEA